ncbi:MAG: glycosyltransferase involved in cell wall biosynthesis [Flavobacterium sp.]|jgi:glycosyltransferase involved in cell wall biosynthesis
MRIIQVIDSLEAGGSERMAVSYANGLAEQIDFSGLVVTRKEGSLLSHLSTKVDYLFLNKKSSLDLKAVFALRRYIVKNKITVVHTHSTSFFIGFLLKLIYPSIRMLWHDHYGNSEFLKARATFPFRLTLPFFDGVISVNQKLQQWAKQKLHFKNTIYLPNFPSKENGIESITILKGVAGKRIVFLANLRPQKNHFLLLEVAKKLKETYPNWTFHLVGKDFEDDYSAAIKMLIVEYALKESVFLYGSKSDIQNVLEQADICVLTSKSEGLPLALLEYGKAKKPVLVTDVGEIPAVVQNGKNGLVVAQKEELFYAALVKLIANESLRGDYGESIYETILNNYSEEEIIKQYLNWIQRSST